jgi:mannose-6-phosphate isomerase-like protein (cupin superfamily)
MTHWKVWLGVILSLAGCAHTTQPESTCPDPAPVAQAEAPAPGALPPAVLDAIVGNQRLNRPLAELLALSLLAPTETFKITEIARDERSSHHVVSLRDAEPLHRHDMHDLLVVVLEGHGDMLLGDATHPIGQGSIVYIPRATVHSMRNATEKPLTGYAMFFPPFDGKDRVLLNAPAVVAP